MLKVEVAYADGRDNPVAYCVTSLTADGTGEIDSLFVEQDYRGEGIGTALTQRALGWLDGRKVVSKIVCVAFGNDSALEFYKRFGFVADNISLRQSPDAGCHPSASPTGGPTPASGSSGVTEGPASVS
jgi:ribosomal protein S18 acetylase RimI-like enzyme